MNQEIKMQKMIDDLRKKKLSLQEEMVTIDRKIDAIEYRLNLVSAMKRMEKYNTKDFLDFFEDKFVLYVLTSERLSSCLGHLRNRKFETFINPKEWRVNVLKNGIKGWPRTREDIPTGYVIFSKNALNPNVLRY
jgi:hypothetical protein